MPVINQTDGMGVFLDDITSRVKALETAPGLVSSSIQDPQGNIRVIFGLQADDSYGIWLYDIANNVPRLKLGEQADGTYGLWVFDAAGNVQVKLGDLSSGIFGLAVEGPTGLQRVAGASNAYQAEIDTWASTAWTALPNDPRVTVTIGDSGQALCAYGGAIGTNTAGAQGAIALTIDGVRVVGLPNVATSSGSGGMQCSGTLTSLVSGLSVGSHTFSLNYQANGITGADFVNFSRRSITIQPM